MTMECPTSESLKHYAIGDLDEATSDVIERHIGDCPACEETVASFDTADDTLIRHLPLAAGADARKTTEAPGWLARLRQGPPAGSPNLDAELPQEAWPTSPPDDGSPAELAAYELLGVLGQGGMGVVYRARHRQLRRHVALKVLNPRLMATPEGVRRFEREIQILGGLRHGGIVMATDAGRVRGSAYLVMELVEGIDLSRLVKQSGPLPIPEACEAARQMAEALAAAHEAGTVHRDVKPSNVMIDRHGRIKLLDFGLARLAALSTQSLDTSVGCLLGTLEYMAPEQADSDQPTDPRADYFGLGATLFYLLTGRPPRSGGPRASLLQQLSSLTADAPRVSTIRPDIPAELDEFLARLLDRDPQRRPASAREIADQLNVWAAGGSLASRVENLPTPEPEPPTEAEAEAQRSLSELLGHDEAAELASLSTAAAPAPVAADAGRGRRRAWPAVVGGLGGAIALLFGMTIVLQMSEGTLRIESESDNVQVEVVNDKDQVTDLKIDRTGKETKLSAGQYRIRLAGSHDGMVLDNSTVTLTRGKTTVAKITREKQATQDVFRVSGNGGFTLKEKGSRIVVTKEPLATVDGFDSHILKVTATGKPNEIRVEAVSGTGNTSTRLILVDRKGGRFLVDVLIDEHEPPFHVGNSGKPYLPSGNTGGHLDLAKSNSAPDPRDMVGGHGDLVDPPDHGSAPKTIPELPHGQNPQTGAKRVIYYFFNSNQLSRQAVTSVIRSLKSEGFIINEVDHSIYRVLPPHLSHIRTTDSPQLVVLEGKTTLQHVSKVGGDVDRVRRLLTDVGIVSGAKSEEPTLLFFKANWCGPSKRMQPAIDAIRNSGYAVREFDADENKAEFDVYNIQATPTFLIQSRGKVVHRTVGVTTNEILIAGLRASRAGVTLQAAVAARDAALQKWRTLETYLARGTAGTNKAEEQQAREQYFALRDEVEALMPQRQRAPAEPERLYKGRRELDWWRTFRIETNTELKLEAARALLALAREMPPSRQFDTTLDVAAELLRISGSKPPFEAAFMHSEPNVDEKLRTPLQHFQRELIQQIRNLPAAALAEHLPDTLLHSPDSQAALAYFFFNAAAYGMIEATPATARTCLDKLQSESKGDRRTLAILAQAQLIHHGTPNQRNRLIADLTDLGKSLSIPPESEFQRRLQRELIGRILPFFNCYECRGRFSEISARLVLQDLLNGTRTIDMYFGSQHDAKRNPYRVPYAPEYVSHERHRTHHFLQSWVPVVNEYFARRGDGPFVERDKTFATALNYVVQVHSDGDAWPTDITAAWLTARLRSYYAADASAADQAGLLPGTALSVLGLIVAIKGELPDFVVKEAPRSKLLVRKLVRFEQMMTGKIDSSDYEEERKAWQGIIFEAPYEILKLCVTSTVANNKRGHFFEWLDSASSSSHSLYERDLLLMLNLLEPLTGQSEAQDKEIASLFVYRPFSRNLMLQVEDLTGSKLKARAHMRRVLHSLASKAKSKELVEALRPYVLAIDNQDPGTASRTVTTTPTANAEGASVTIPAGMRLVSIPVEKYRLERGTILPGDRVDLIATIQLNPLPDTYTKDPVKMLHAPPNLQPPLWMNAGLIAQDVEVIAIDRQRQVAPAGPVSETLTILCTADQAQKIQSALEKGLITISLRRGKDQAADPAQPPRGKPNSDQPTAAASTIPAGTRLVSVSLDLGDLPGKTVRQGDRIDVACVITEVKAEGGNQRISTPAQHVEIFAFDRTSLSETTKANPDSPVATISLLCTPEQAASLQLAATKGTLIAVPEGQQREVFKRRREKYKSWLTATKDDRKRSEPAGAAANVVLSEQPNAPAEPLRLYQGKTEVEWRKIFLAETSPVAKLDAARALLALANEHPPSRQLASILEIGDEIGRAGFGKPPLELAFAYHRSPPEHFTKWRITSVRSELAGTFMKYQDEMYEQLQQNPAEILANGLSTAMQGGSDLHIANAYAVLVGVGYAHIKDDPAASKVVLERLEGVYKNKDHGRLALLARAYFLQHASAAKRQEILVELEKLSREGNTGTETSLQRLIKAELRAFVFKFSECPECQKDAALMASRLIVSEMQKRRISLGSFEMFDPGNNYPSRVSNPYNANNHVILRAQLQYFLPQWFTAVNEYLAEHRAPPYDDAARDIFRMVDLVTPLYSDDDTWPADKTAALLTEQLRAYYTADPTKTTDQGMKDLLPSATPAVLLTQIVRLTGEVPDFVRKEQLRSKPISQKFARYSSALQGKLNQSRIEDEAEDWKDLMEQAPCEVVRVCVRQARNWSHSQYLLYHSLASATHRQNYSGQIYLDPVLMLRLLADEVGQDERQDQAIAGFFNDRERRKAWRRQFEELFAGRSRTRHHVRKMLQQMAATSKSKELTDALLPFLGETRAEAPSATATAESKPPASGKQVSTSITVHLTRDQRDKLVAGNRIDIIGTFETTTQTDTIRQTRTIAEDLELTAIDRLKVTRPEDVKETGNPALITVLCTVQQASELHKRGPLTITARSKGASAVTPPPAATPPVWVPKIQVDAGRAKPGTDSEMLKRRAEMQQIQLAETLQREKEFFKGTWLVESLKVDGAEPKGIETREMKYIFSPDGKVAMVLDKKTTDRTYELDVSSTPKKIIFSSKDDQGAVLSHPSTYEVINGKIQITSKKIAAPHSPANPVKKGSSADRQPDFVMVLTREK